MHTFFAVPSSASWRIPLALQFIPGVSLCLGCFLLPPSPRFLVLRGRVDDAMASLARLRLRTPEEAAHDPLVQVRPYPSHPRSILANIYWLRYRI